MESLALILGFVALLLAVIGRFEQRQMLKQINRLRQIVHKLQNQPPAETPDQAQRMPKVDRQASAPTKTAIIQPDQATLDTSPVSEAEQTTNEDSKPTTPEASKKETLHRLTSIANQVQGSALSESSTTATASKAATPPRPKREKVSLEERLGAGVYIWIGGIALMLAGAFLVKYSFDNNLLSVETRLTLVGVFGALLVLASLWLRKRADKVAAAVCGAGVADMFATVLAATAIFNVMNPWWGFALMAVITAIAVGMSLLHGPFVALLGLVGGFATPTLISGEDTAWGPTFTYLLLLEVGLSVITRKKQWFSLSALTLLASVITTLAYTLFAWDPNHSHWLIMFALGTAVVFVINAAKASDEEESKLSWIGRIWLGIGAVGTSALLMAMFVAYSHFSMIELSSLGLLAAGALVLSRFDRRYITLAYLGAGLCGMMLLAWPLAYKAGFAKLDPSQYYLLAIGYGSVFFVGGLLCLWRNTQPGMFAWLSAASSLVFVLLAHLGLRHDLPLWLDWWVVYTAVSLLTINATGIVWRTRERHGTLIIDAYALMASASATFAIWFGFDHPWVAPAWCALAVVTAAIGTRLNLRWQLIPTCWLTAGCISQLIYPGVLRYEMPMRPVFNTMLAHFGLPALGFAAIAWIYHRNPWLWVRSVFQALALVTATVAITLQLRLGFKPENPWSASVSLVQWATYIGFWLTVSSVVLWRFKQASLDGLRRAAIGIGFVGLVTCVLNLLLYSNPLLTKAAVGDTLILNWLLYIYGLPCALACVFAWLLPDEAGSFKKLAGLVSLVLFFALITLEVRHGFMGQDAMPIQANGTSLHEWATYSVTWLILAIVLSWIGSRWQIKPFEWAGAAIGVAGFAASIIGSLGIDNPLFNQADVGSLRVFNWLLYLYGLPCVLAAVLGYTARIKEAPLKPIAIVVSLLLLFVFVTLQVRQGFVGSNLLLEAHPITQAESYGYSMAWVSLALILLAGGLMTRSTALRYGSLAVMLVAVGKVALDSFNLQDLWRVLSLLGLGLSLVVLGYVYQRYVFGKPKQSDAEAEEPTAFLESETD